MSKLNDLLERVSFPETPEDRDDAESEIQAMLIEAWDTGHERGFWNGRMSQLTIPYDAPEPLVGKQDAEANNPYRSKA